jgi:uncharacterized protein YecT (DUF1311 family)
MRLFLTVAAFTAMAPAAAAFDCNKAATPVERTICGDAGARDANDAMEGAFASLREGLSADARAALVAGQRAWLKYRDARCGPQAACLAEESARRRNAIEATPPGMIPDFRFKAGRPGGYEVVIDVYRFADGRDPRGAAFDAVVDRMIADSPLSAPPDADNHAPYGHEIAMTIALASPNLLSAIVNVYDYSGGAHPNSSTEAVAIDRRTGELLNAPRLFGRDGVRKLAEDCARQVVRERSPYADMEESAALQQLEEEFPGVVHNHASDMRRWHFRPDGAVLTFDSYAIGPYAAGPFECVFDREAVRAAIRDKELIRE